MSQPEREPAVNDARLHVHDRPDTELTQPQQLIIDDYYSTLSPAYIDEYPEDEEEEHHSTDTLSFPLLESDGSLPGLREASVPARHYHTPPAALSSLGAKARMAKDQEDMESSTGSLADSQYDMMEDVSDVSTDGRETASVASTDHAESEDEGEVTPEEDDGEYFDRSVPNLAGTLQVSTHQPAYEGDLSVGSYMTDELETPRQSTIRPPPSSTRTSSLPAALAFTNDSSPVYTPVSFRVSLCCFKHDVSSDVVHEIGKRIASSLGSGEGDAFEVVDLPPTSEDAKGSVLIRYENIEITVDQTYGPLLAGSTDRGSFTLPNQDIAELNVLYLPDEHKDARSFIEFADALEQQNAPSLIITEATEERAYVEKYYGRVRCVNVEDFIYHGCQGPDWQNREYLHHLLGEKLAAKGWTPNTASEKKSKTHTPSMPPWLNRSAIFGILLLLVLQAMAWFDRYSHADPTVELANRRATLSRALVGFTNLTTAADDFQVNYLLPQVEVTGTEVHSTVVAPNYMAFSVLTKPKKRLPNPHSSRANRAGNDLRYNLTTLINGVYVFTLPVEDAYSLVDFEVDFKNPKIHVSLSNDFGSRMWQRNVYEQAGTDLAKTINKDVTVARRAAKSLTDRFTLELSAGAAATKNVTSQLALRMTRDVHVFVNTAATVFGKVASSGTETATKVSTDLMVMRKDLIKRADDVKKSVATTAHNIKDLIIPKKTVFTSPLARSRQRALGLKDAVAGKKGGDDTPTPDVVPQSRSLFSAFKKKHSKDVRPPAESGDVDYCAGAPDPKSCREENTEFLQLAAKLGAQLSDSQYDGYELDLSQIANSKRHHGAMKQKIREVRDGLKGKKPKFVESATVYGYCPGGCSKKGRLGSDGVEGTHYY